MIYTINEAAAYLRLPAGHVVDLAKAGHIRCCKIGNCWRFTSDDLDRFEAANNVPRIQPIPLPCTNGRATRRNVFSTLFKHAIRQGWTTTNPIQFVRQSAKRQKEPDVLSPEEIDLLLTELQEPARTIVLLAAVAGMRRGDSSASSGKTLTS